jgi:hypothetical protein
MAILLLTVSPLPLLLWGSGWSSATPQYQQLDVPGRGKGTVEFGQQHVPQAKATTLFVYRRCVRRLHGGETNDVYSFSRIDSLPLIGFRFVVLLLLVHNLLLHYGNAVVHDQTITV